jgi:hypothetical protein
MSRTGGNGRVKTSLGRSEGGLDWQTPAAVLMAFAEELATSGIPLCRELAELVVLADATDGDTETHVLIPDAVVELLEEPMTAAETASTLLLATIAARVRDAHLDDQSVLRVMALATKVVARFETYVADREPLDVV